MAGSTSIPPNTSIQLDHVHCSNPHQLNQKDQASSIVESYLVQPSTPSPPPPSNSAPNQLHLPQQNLSTLPPPPPPPNLGFAEHIILQASEPSPPIPSSLGRNHNQINHDDPTSTALQPNWGSTQPITGPYHQQPSPVSFQNPRAEPNLAIQNHVPWSLQWILRIDPSNLLPQIQESPAAISAVKAQPSEPITYNLNPPAIFVVSSNSQPNISAPPSQSSNPTNVPNHFQEKSEPSNTSKPALQQGPQQQTYGNSQKKNVANKAANLANLLPTGTVLLFQALTPSLANSTGKCQYFHKYLIGFVIIICAATCFLSSFTDSFMVDGKLFYGFATFKDFWVLNYDSITSQDVKTKVRENTKKHKIIPKDYVHAFGSLLVFLIFAFSSSDVLHCFFPDGGENQYSMVLYLPLVAGVLSSFLFSLFPTQRKGFGYGDTIPVPHY
ncbi:hypothetical protein RGQ29_014222 [Quercus rubra]|uniref:Uncharacterized protein n=1 Tax=Quercus rubra TaxID=3512 RepID=A0AAN7FUV3_QUERU|nr:hypothetical protein RGQ29_014222 [Quercus rubra]